MGTRTLTIGFTSLLVFVFATALIQSRHFTIWDGVGPWLSSSVGLILSLVLLVSTTRSGSRAGGKREAEQLQTNEFDSEGTHLQWKTLGIFALSFLAVLGGIALVGLPISVLVFTILYPKLQGHIRWPVLLLTALICFAFLAYFTNVMRLYMPEPLILKWGIKLPRLLGGIY